MTAEDFLRLFRTRWLRPTPVPPLSPESERKRQEAQAAMLRDIARMYGREPLEPGRLGWRRRLRRFLSR